MASLWFMSWFHVTDGSFTTGQWQCYTGDAEVLTQFSKKWLQVEREPLSCVSRVREIKIKKSFLPQVSIYNMQVFLDVHTSRVSERDPHWSTGLGSLGPNEEQKEREHEGSQDHEGCIHPLRQWADLMGAHQGQLDWE